MEQIKRRGDLRRRDQERPRRVLVACSGGGDSMALLAFLWAAQKSLGLTLSVAHAHHGLRPEAKEDAALVRDFCRFLDVDLAEAHLEVRNHARQQHLGLETAARELRWAWLKSEAASCGADMVATGHSLDDHTETILIRLARGGGMGSLTPLPPRQGLRWSPLIEARREELRRYLRQKRIPWKEDASNADDFTPRNRWRKLLESMRKEAPQLDQHLLETHLQISEMRHWRDEQVASWEGQRWKLTEEGLLLCGPFQEVELRWVLECALQRKDMTREADFLRALSPWVAKVIHQKSRKTKQWGGWQLKSCDAHWPSAWMLCKIH